MRKFSETAMNFYLFIYFLLFLPEGEWECLDQLSGPASAQATLTSPFCNPSTLPNEPQPISNIRDKYS